MNLDTVIGSLILFVTWQPLPRRKFVNNNSVTITDSSSKRTIVL